MAMARSKSWRGSGGAKNFDGSGNLHQKVPFGWSVSPDLLWTSSKLLEVNLSSSLMTHEGPAECHCWGGRLQVYKHWDHRCELEKCWSWSLVKLARKVKKDLHCWQMGPYLGTRVPIGTLFGILGPYWVSIYFSGSLFSVFWLDSREECQFTYVSNVE